MRLVQSAEDLQFIVLVTASLGTQLIRRQFLLVQGNKTKQLARQQVTSLFPREIFFFGHVGNVVLVLTSSDKENNCVGMKFAMVTSGERVEQVGVVLEGAPSTVQSEYLKCLVPLSVGVVASTTFFKQQTRYTHTYSSFLGAVSTATSMFVVFVLDAFSSATPV